MTEALPVPEEVLRAEAEDPCGREDREVLREEVRREPAPDGSEAPEDSDTAEMHIHITEAQRTTPSS